MPNEKTNLEIEARLCELHCQACRAKIDQIDLATDIPELAVDHRAVRRLDERIDAGRSLLSRAVCGRTIGVDDIALVQVAADLHDESDDDA